MVTCADSRQAASCWRRIRQAGDTFPVTLPKASSWYTWLLLKADINSRVAVFRFMSARPRRSDSRGKRYLPASMTYLVTTKTHTVLHHNNTQHLLRRSMAVARI